MSGQIDCSNEKTETNILPVPFLSQWDDDAHYSRGDCGVVSACMIARWKGIATTPDGMLLRAGLPIGRLSYTFQEVILAARSVGLQLAARQNVTRSAICAELDAGRPVIPLLRYGEISGNQDTFDGAHFWVCVGYDAEARAMIVNDPNFWGAKREQGHNRRVPFDEFDEAIGDALHATGNGAYQSIFVA